VHKDVYALVRALRAGRLSRNRDYARFEQPCAQRAQRVHRRLQALERELREPTAQVRLEPIDCAGDGRDARYALVVESPALRLRRVAYLARPELDLLCEDPELCGRLGTLPLSD
jgi:hypothetical protein